MSLLKIFAKELEQESNTTRKMLSRIPEDKYNWAPHEKSMNIQRLATHIAELPGWINMTLHTSGLDFESNPYSPVTVRNNKELLEYFEKTYEEAEKELATANEAELDKEWVLRMGTKILSKSSKAEVIRMALNQIVHHRAQIGVYLRLLNVPIPGSYGPSADENF